MTEVANTVKADENLNWHDACMSVTDVFEKDHEALKVQGSIIGTLGNFSASVGKAKSKKTFNVSALAAAALINGTVLAYTADLPADRRRVLYVDTEQSPYHCHKVMTRIFRLAGLPLDHDSELFLFMGLRKYSPNQRIEMIRQAISQIQGLGLVIIDGIRDLVYDINNPSEATNTMSLLMQWTDEYKIHLHTVLHQNKTDDNARGHIGTELNNKAETVLQVEKASDNPELSIVSAPTIRDKTFEPFAFRINDDGLPELARDYKAPAPKPGRPMKDPEDIYTQFTEQQHRAALEELFRDGDMGYGAIEDSIAACYLNASGVKMGHNKCVRLITFLKNKRMIVLDNDTKKYSYKRDFHY